MLGVGRLRMDVCVVGIGGESKDVWLQNDTAYKRWSCQWGPDLPFFGHAGHADPLDGWRCCSQKRVMSIPIQVRQL